MKVTINKDGETTVEGSFNEVQVILQDLGYFNTVSEDPSPAKSTLDPSIFNRNIIWYGDVTPARPSTFHAQVFTNEGAAIPVTYGNGVSFAEAAREKCIWYLNHLGYGYSEFHGK